MRKFLLLVVFFFGTTIIAQDHLEEDDACCGELAACLWNGMNCIRDNFCFSYVFRCNTTAHNIILEELENKESRIDLALAIVLFASGQKRKFSKAMLKDFYQQDSIGLGRANHNILKRILLEMRNVSYVKMLYENLRRLTRYQRRSVHQSVRGLNVCESFRHDFSRNEGKLKELNACLKEVLPEIADYL